MTNLDFINRVAELDVFDTKSEAKDTVAAIIDIIKDTVASGEEVRIAGLGKFYKFEKTKDGKGTGKFVPKFQAFKDFKDEVGA